MSGDDMPAPTGAHNVRRWSLAARVAVPLVLVAAFLLFPFDWLADVWPAYGQVFDIVFTGPASHMIGHATLFFLAGMLLLLTLPALRLRPRLYIALLALGALSEECIQGLARQRLPTLGDGRDLLLDVLGFCAAYGVFMLTYAILARRRAPGSA